MKLTRLVPLALPLVFSLAAVSLQAQASGGHLANVGANHQPVDLRGGLVTPPLPKPKFTLTDTSGAPFDFWSRTQGRVALLFFGYTHCPDVCPMHMAYLASALKKLPPNVAADLVVVFVTTDPERDTPKVLRAWLDNFDKRFVGLTGSNSAIEAAQIAANINPAKKTTSLGGSPQINHAAFVVAYTKDNLAHVIYPAGISQEDWVHDLPRLVSAIWPATEWGAD